MQNKKTKRTITLELSNVVWNTLDKYGYDYKKNIENELFDIAIIIWNEESNTNEDIGTASVREMREQNESTK